MINWRWKYFTRDELKCKGDGSLVINEDALDKLEHMREIIGAPLKINSAYRSPSYNKKVGGADNSMHTQGRAFDIAIAGHNPSALYTAALQAGFTGFGFYRTFLHVDTGAKRWWGKYRKQYTNKHFSKPPAKKANNFVSVDYQKAEALVSKETEAPNKIEGVLLSDKQKVAAVTTTSVAATTAAVTTIDPSIIAEHAPTLINIVNAIKELNPLVALAVIIVVSLGGLIYFIKRKRK